MPPCALFPFIVWRSVRKAVKLQKEPWCVLFFFQRTISKSSKRPTFIFSPARWSNTVCWRNSMPLQCLPHYSDISSKAQLWSSESLPYRLCESAMPIYFHCLYYSPLPSTSTVRGNMQTFLLSCEVLVTWMYVHVLRLLRTTVIKHCCWLGLLHRGPTQQMTELCARL